MKVAKYTTTVLKHIFYLHKNGTITYYYFLCKKNKRKEEVKKNTEIFKRIIDLLYRILFIGKRKLSYRGNKFEHRLNIDLV